MSLKAILLGLAGFALFSTHDIVVRYLGGIYSPIQILFFTSLLSFPLVTLMLVRDPTYGNLRPVHPWWVALRSFAMAMGGMCGFYAVSTLPLAQAYSIFFTVPLLITILAIPILGEKVGIHRAGAVLVGLVGVVIVVRPGSAELGLGHLAAFGLVLFASLQSIIARKIGREERRVVMMLFPLAATFAVMGGGLWLVYEPMPLIDLAAMGIIALLGFAAALCLVGAYTVGDAAIVAPMQYSQIIWAIFFGYFLYGESVDQQTLIGAGIIITSGLYVVVREAFAGTSDNTPVLRTRSRGFAPGAFRVSQALRKK
ncbi:DMT family transporter [Shimia abyssi]|uniref:Putative membrane protein n=1 Tax=Shimia abyssi TaxID=1662395 RepID=A0A2P8FA97_9RHOB|nr:DMT family transporter [Shimia abyssi]PSL18636.1 putative membrane protein [Shimia abyssi]